MTTITLFSALAVRKALDDVVVDAFTRRSGIEVDVVFDPTVALLRRIGAGETFDVMIGVTSSFDDQALRGIVDLPSRTPVARTGVGMAVAPEAPRPDIGTESAFVSTLLGARSVAYSRTGASGIYFAELIGRLGIADRINERATIIEKGFVAETVVDGRADIAIQQQSELLFVPEAQIVGPFPDEVQHYTEFSATLAAGTGAPAASRALVEFLTGPLARDAYARTQLEPAPTHL